MLLNPTQVLGPRIWEGFRTVGDTSWVQMMGIRLMVSDLQLVMSIITGIGRGWKYWVDELEVI